MTPNGVDPAFSPGSHPVRRGTTTSSRVGAVAAAEEPAGGARRGRAAGLPLVVAGPVKDEALAARLRAARRAICAGYVPQEELVELYRGAACLVQASRFEGFGLPVLEAMASGTPVVVVDEPALRRGRR